MFTVQIINGFFPVCELATGFMIIKRQVIEGLCKANPHLKYKTDMPNTEKQFPELIDHYYNLFEVKIVKELNDRLLSEDYAFCYNAIQAGYEVWAYVHSKLNHMGCYLFYGDFMKHLAISKDFIRA
jgi:hypothetical protein